MRRALSASSVSRAVLAVLVAVATLVVAVPPASAGLPALRDTYGASIDPYPRYEGQTTCTSTLQPGTARLAELLRQSYPGTNPWAYVRDCSSGGRSEHKDGRAIDWMLDVGDPAEKRVADEFIAWMTAPDRHGNADAMARRLGIMYIMWDGAMWQGWQGEAGIWDRSKDYGHRDHIHISLGWPGARATTSFYTGVPYCDTSSSSCPVKRLAGTDRYATAAAVSRRVPASTTAVIASGAATNLVDGLVAAPLAKRVGAPVLLTAPTGLPAATRDELVRRGTRTAYVLGGRGAVDDAVLRQLEQMGIEPTRLEGHDRYATAAAVAAEVRRLGGGDGTVALASGAQASLVDALTVGAASAAVGRPVLLTAPSALPGPTAEALRAASPRQVLLVGGEGAVNAGVEQSVRDTVTPHVVRLAGSDRHGTAVAVAQHHGGVPVGTVVVSSGMTANLVDALPAGALGRLLITSRTNDLPPVAHDWLSGRAAAVDQAWVVGGEGATGYGVVAGTASAID